MISHSNLVEIFRGNLLRRHRDKHVVRYGQSKATGPSKQVAGCLWAVVWAVCGAVGGAQGLGLVGSVSGWDSAIDKIIASARVTAWGRSRPVLAMRSCFGGNLKHTGTGTPEPAETVVSSRF